MAVAQAVGVEQLDLMRAQKVSQAVVSDGAEGGEQSQRRTFSPKLHEANCDPVRPCRRGRGGSRVRATGSRMDVADRVGHNQSANLAIGHRPPTVILQI